MKWVLVFQLQFLATSLSAEDFPFFCEAQTPEIATFEVLNCCTDQTIQLRVTDRYGRQVMLNAAKGETQDRRYFVLQAEGQGRSAGHYLLAAWPKQDFSQGFVEYRRKTHGPRPKLGKKLTPARCQNNFEDREH